MDFLGVQIGGQAPTRTIGAFYICEYCHKDILIQRWTCPICDYDICETCHLSGHDEMCKDHEDWHPMVQVFVWVQIVEFGWPVLFAYEALESWCCKKCTWGLYGCVQRSCSSWPPWEWPRKCIGLFAFLKNLSVPIVKDLVQLKKLEDWKQ